MIAICLLRISPHLLAPERHEVAALPQQLPSTMRPGGIWISFSTVIAVTVLPQPDSPTTPSVSPAVDDEVHAVDRANHAVVGPEVGLQSADLEQPLSHVTTGTLTRRGQSRYTRSVPDARFADARSSNGNPRRSAQAKSD